MGMMLYGYRYSWMAVSYSEGQVSASGLKNNTNDVLSAIFRTHSVFGAVEKQKCSHSFKMLYHGMTIIIRNSKKPEEDTTYGIKCQAYRRSNILPGS